MQAASMRQPTNPRIAAIVQDAAERLKAGYQVSKKGVPHLIFTRGGMTYSAVFFARTGEWGIFWPFPSRGAEQTRIRVGSYPALERWISEIG